MLRIFVVALAILISAASFATSISGKLVTVVGTTTSTITVGTTAVNLTLDVAGTDKTYTVLILGSTGSEYPSGTAFTIIQKTSIPFGGTYTADTCLAQSDYSGGITGRRTVPMSSTGALTENIAFPSPSYGGVAFYMPSFTLGSLSFPNGITVQYESLISSFSLSIPTGSTTTLGTVQFPASLLAPYGFEMVATGNGELDFTGEGNESLLTVAGNMQISGNTFTTASLTIGSADDE